MSKINKNFSKKRYLLINLIIMLLIIITSLVIFSIDIDGNFNFLTALDIKNNEIAYLAIGMGAIACFIVAISLNISGEAIQSTMRNSLVSPFTLGITSSMTLAYVIGSFFTSFSLYWIALIAISIILLVNILPIYFLSISKYKTNNNVFVYYGLSITIFLTTIITLLSYFSKPQDFNILGWMMIATVTFSNEKYIIGSIFFILGFIIFIFIIKKIHILENNYFKASTLGINLSFLNMISLISVSLMAIGGFIAYAPFTLLGFAIPYITKRYLIKIYDIRYSVLTSTLLSIQITLLSYFINLFLHIDVNVLMILIMTPFIGIMMFDKRNNYVLN